MLEGGEADAATGRHVGLEMVSEVNVGMLWILRGHINKHDAVKRQAVCNLP